MLCSACASKFWLCLPSPAVQVPSFYPLQSDTDSHMEAADVDAVEGSDAFYADGADDARS